MLIQAEQDQTDCICKLESNIDDCTGEALSYVMQRLLEAGAKDVYFTPIYMKKNRPAYQINVICAEEDITKLEEDVYKRQAFMYSTMRFIKNWSLRESCCTCITSKLRIRPMQTHPGLI